MMETWTIYIWKQDRETKRSINGNKTGGSGQEWKVAVWPMMERRHPLHIDSVSQSVMATSPFNGNETGGSGQEWKVAVWPMMVRRHPLHIESGGRILSERYPI
jgi:hypothetical protein